MRRNDGLVCTFTVSQWYTMPEAMARIAEVAHEHDVPVSWQLSYQTAVVEKPTLDLFHERYGDEIVMSRGDESIDDWRTLLPWAILNTAGGARPTSDALASMKREGIEGVWGYCDQQIGPDGITHWGCPWGIFPLSSTTTFIPSREPSTILGLPWTLRDLHKCYHLGQAINFAIDPIEMIRSRTLCRGENITFFQDLFDELAGNIDWNERVYCCLHEEANGAWIPEGRDLSDEGATREESEDMYRMMSEWIRYAKGQGATMTTLPRAVKDHLALTGGATLPSTLLTRDKFRGRIRHYVPPLPDGIAYGDMGPAGNYPETLFHFDSECQLVFENPNLLPSTILDYAAQHRVDPGRPYPEEKVTPRILSWSNARHGDERTFTYRLYCYYSMPCGITEWGDFSGWEVVETNALSARIIGGRVLFLRMRLQNREAEALKINEEMEKGHEFHVTLRRVTSGRGGRSFAGASRENQARTRLDDRPRPGRLRA